MAKYQDLKKTGDKKIKGKKPANVSKQGNGIAFSMKIFLYLAD